MRVKLRREYKNNLRQGLGETLGAASPGCRAGGSDQVRRSRASSYIVALVLAGLPAVLTSGAVEAQERSAASSLPPHYAESVAIVGIAPDGGEEISIRLGRFPGRDRGTLWMAAFVGGVRYAVSDPGLDLGAHRAATPVESDAVVFAATSAEPVDGERSGARFESRGRESAAMEATVEARGRAHESYHPPVGPGTVPLRIEAEFRASGPGVRVRSGRLEVFGRVRVTVHAPMGTYHLDVPGKWHEQVGQRSRFAPAFTYFQVQGPDVALLARGGTGRTWGYALIRGSMSRVVAFTIDAYGSPRRAFRVKLEDGRSIAGEAEVLRQASVPIEGQRRPGATVRARTNLGVLVGHLNDWQPKED